MPVTSQKRRAAEMAADPSGGFRTVLDAVTTPFTYRVVAGAVTSPTFEIAVAHPPRVTRIDVDYTFPAGLGVAPRTEKDGGDIYAPAGTDVRLHVFTDRPAATGEMTDLVKAGIIDPAKVTRSAIENAASIAAMVLTTETLVTDIPEAPMAAPAPPPMDY